MSRLAYYRNTLQFDLTRHIRGTRQYRIQCSCCAASVVNGGPLHEQNCPQNNYECKGCNNRVPSAQHYCEDCR